MKWITIVVLCLFSAKILFAQDQIKIDSLQIKLSNSKDDTTSIKLLLELSSCYSQTNLLQAIAFAEKALNISSKIDNKLLEVRSNISIGNSLTFLGDYDEAMKKFLFALQIAQENKFESEELIALTHLGIIQDRIQQYENALTYYFKALSIYNRAVENGTSAKKVKNIQALYNNIGNIYEVKKDFNTAEKYYLKGLALSEQQNDLINIGVICNNLGKLEIQHKNFDKAYTYLMKSLTAREENKDKSGIAKSYIFLGNYYQTTNQLKQAENFAKKALEIGLEMSEQLTILNSTMLLYEINKSLGNNEIALKYHEQFKQANDSLINTSKIEEMTRLQIQYNYEKLEAEKELKQQKIKYTFIIVLSMLILIIIILALLFFLARNRTKRIKLENEKLEESMNLKNKELTTNVIYLLKKNELIDSITLRLLNMKERLKPENREPVQKIIFDIQALTDNNVWDEFELRFQSVHQNFYQNLQKKFPDLTPSEIKLAALLKLNMTTKEIASLTGQSANSLETARYRLRKKLGITNQEINLVNFLLKI